MDQTLHDLGRILLEAIPTLILLFILHLYLKWMFFKPLDAVLEKRREATEGAKAAAEAHRKHAASRRLMWRRNLSSIPTFPARGKALSFLPCERDCYVLSTRSQIP